MGPKLVGFVNFVIFRTGRKAHNWSDNECLYSQKLNIATKVYEF